MPPRRPQELSKRSQDGPKSSQDAPNSGPRVPKIPPRPSQERPRGLQYRPESAQTTSKAPRGLQDRPKSAQDASKTAQDASKTAPRAPILLSSRFPDSKSKRTPLPRCFLPLKVCGGTRAASYNYLWSGQDPFKTFLGGRESAPRGVQERPISPWKPPLGRPSFFKVSQRPPR